MESTSGYRRHPSANHPSASYPEESLTKIANEASAARTTCLIRAFFGFLVPICVSLEVDFFQARLIAQDSSSTFATSVAPLLLENCKGCHIGGQQASGGLRMDTPAQLMRGGNSGEVIQVGQASQSLLISKLKGEASGQRMPAGGRPPLSSQQIEQIARWIDQGADFDGSSPEANIATIVQLAWASDASHAELFDRRKQKALERWRVATDSEPISDQTEELFAIGNIGKKRLKEILDEFQLAVDGVKRQLKLPSTDPLVQGGVVLFVFKSRYDYSEFGRMQEKRELPKEWSSHWRADAVDAYAVVADGSFSALPLASQAHHLITGVYWGSLPEVPYWFAEGYARNLVASKFRKTDSRVNRWRTELKSAGQRLTAGSDLVAGKLDEETVGLIGMAIVESMNTGAARPKFQLLLNQLKKGTTFSDAMSKTFGPPDEFVKTWLGK